MKKWSIQKLKLCASLFILVILLEGVDLLTKKLKLKSFNKTLSMYPTKNLEDFTIKEGFRDQEFEKGDKGTWIVNSEMVIEPKGKNMESRNGALYKS